LVIIKEQEQMEGRIKDSFKKAQGTYRECRKKLRN
jgi:hypothetical protein